ncbi:hypothetical protein [Phaeodactylibacter luteus]|uniref:Uncharacterized protein n=1 Tax=Phaeodactylibacter luteus TaxID=1564516 RepID=A0A5C6RLA4_9BACT|nr:hypothetical protein [Phaeodactylibacter luteus]TXB62735.1 hypothetical protein FRY97_12285 [Phaeodactylibacter luteus]
MSKKIKGKVAYQNLEGGFWSIIGAKGEQLRPVNMPEQLKTEGAAVEISYRPVEEEMSMIMWGQAVTITAFHTLSPQ